MGAWGSEMGMLEMVLGKAVAWGMAFIGACVNFVADLGTDGEA